MRRLVFWSILTCSLAANATVATFAVRERLGRAASGRQVATDEPCLFSRVTLDPAQKAKVSALRDDLMRFRRAHAERARDLRVQLAALLFGEPVDQTRIDATLAEIAGAQVALQRRVVTHVLAVREILRPEQRGAFEALVREHMQAGGTLSDQAQPSCALEGAVGPR